MLIEAKEDKFNLINKVMKNNYCKLSWQVDLNAN